MRRSKTKLFTSMTAFALVAVVSVGAVIAVFASLVARVESGFSVSYTASNVECIVMGTYSQRYGLQDQSIGTLEFSSETLGEQVVREFPNTIPDINFEGTQDYLEFHFTIQNKGPNGFNVSLLLTGLSDHFKIEYTKSVRATGNTTPNFDFSKDVRTKFVDTYITASGSPKEYLDIGVRISYIGNPETNAKSSGSFNFSLNGLAERPADIWDDGFQKFDKENFEKMLKLISADENASVANMDTINRLATEVTDASEIFNLAGGIKKQGNVVVTLGGLTWNACYLSRAKGAGEADGDVILTLWLTSSQQDAWQGLPADNGEYFGFVEGSLYSDWSANQISGGASAEYPSAMYGTSYIRAVTLNNGGDYATSGTEVDSCEKNSQSLFAMFTMKDFGLSDYIVKPRQVKWQEDQQLAKEIIGSSYNNPNENWSKTMPTTDFNGSYHYESKNLSDAWADDFLWLPSISETGNNGDNHGLWQLNVEQRKNGMLSSTSVIGMVGMTSAEAYNYSWLRSGYNNNATDAYRLGVSGSGSTHRNVNSCYAVRPALHLNLTAAARALNG